MRGILIFGDSIAAGRCIVKSQSWVSQLAHFFDSKDKNNTLIYNLGVAGESTQELIKRFEIECRARTQRRSPDDYFTIVFAIGINDSKGIGSPENYKTPKEVFRRNIENLIEHAKRYAKEIIFIGLTPVDENKTAPLDDNYFLNKEIKIYNDIVNDICINKNITFVKIFENWVKNDYKKFISPDGVHPNELGHKKIFERILIDAANLTFSAEKG